jgi:hypothetical protein
MAPHNDKLYEDYFKERENENWSQVPNGGLTLKQTG